jgi:hypothetical protein
MSNQLIIEGHTYDVTKYNKFNLKYEVQTMIKYDDITSVDLIKSDRYDLVGLRIVYMINKSRYTTLQYAIDLMKISDSMKQFLKQYTSLNFKQIYEQHNDNIKFNKWALRVVSVAICVGVVICIFDGIKLT